MYRSITHVSLIMLLTQHLMGTPQGPDKRQAVNSTIQSVNKLFDTILQELEETHHMHHMSCNKAHDREQELKGQLASLAKENEEFRTIRAELALAQKDLQKALESEAATQQKLVRLQQQAGKELSHMRNEFDAFKSRLEATTVNFDKVFW